MSSSRMPPVGMTRSVGRTASTDRRNCGPPTCAGKSLARPRVPASTSSATVIPPSTSGVVPATSRTAGTGQGDTMKSAPRSIAVRAVSGSSTVPTPTTRSGCSARDAASASCQPLVVAVSSTTSSPASKQSAAARPPPRRRRAIGARARSAPRRSGARPRRGPSSIAALPDQARRPSGQPSPVVAERSSAGSAGSGRDRRWRRARWWRRRGRCAAPGRCRRRWRAPRGSRRRTRRRRRPARPRRRRGPTTSTRPSVMERGGRSSGVLDDELAHRGTARARQPLRAQPQRSAASSRPDEHRAGPRRQTRAAPWPPRRGTRARGGG